MRNVIFLFIWICISLEAFCQSNLLEIKDHHPLTKPLVDSTAYNKWTYVDGPKISNNGKYISYYVKSRLKGRDTTVLKQSEGNWEIRVPGSVYVQFTNDSKIALFRNKDTLNVVRLDKNIIQKFAGVIFFKVPNNGSSEWVAFTTPAGELGMRNLRTGVVKIYKSIKRYSFSENGKFLVMEGEQIVNNELIQSISLLDIPKDEVKDIWKGMGLVQLLFDQSTTMFAFLLFDKAKNDKSLWYYKLGDSKPVLAVNDSLIGIDSSMVLDNISEINKKGDCIYFTVKKLGRIIDNANGSSPITIWSYLDSKLPTAEIVDSQFPISYSFVFILKDRCIAQISKDNELILNRSNDGSRYLVEHTSGNSSPGDRLWSSSAQHSYLLRSIRNKRRDDIKLKGSDIIEVSPSGKYVIYYDKDSIAYFSFDITSGICRNITPRIKTSWIGYYREDLFRAPRGIAGWLNNDVSVLIYDRFDIWIVDPLGKRKPRNLTNGYGLKHNIVFYLGLPNLSNRAFSNQETLILNALNLVSKENGFFQKRIEEVGDPQLLTMDNCIYHLIDNPYTDNAGRYPVKARDENKFIVSRMRANESPNFFFTSDFIKFTQQSYVYPEAEYNWYTTELHSWKRADGSISQGVLYKPENFNDKHSYPVIFYYYEKKSFGLNAYILPESLSGMCNLNIPTFVSNGFLIFTPDIDYKIGDPMQSTYDAVLSSANYISRLPYIDSQRMGIGGCSFGGLQTNYLVTHTNLFAAAYSSSSISDLISAYGDVPARYTSLNSYFEIGQGRMGGTLWEKTESYIKNSPIFRADKVTTPLLLMHTTNDGICSFSQALELFTALRRLGKKVWLLEYSDGNHGIGGKSADDFSIRLFQFFNHYLKGTPAPVWMTKGISEERDSGYKLDYKIKSPGKGLLIDSIFR
ncbi:MULTISPECIES: alpha/beta hydrolase family protein [unclassified Chitinophaga]|uniref:alpha/beta hydrolase family protein n=1 Tax=unclassified Chitinophaga TaxID=2619133 RepID=UPI0030105B2D